MFCRTFLSTVLLLLATASYSAVTAKLERSEIRINETVRLVIETDQVEQGVEPDHSVLTEHFSIVGRASSQNVTFINGVQSSIRQWTIELEPRSVGSFSLGPIPVGNQATKHLRLAVLPEAKTASSSGAEVFIETSTDLDEVYVQQQILYTVKLFVSVELLDGSLTEPEPENTLVKRIGKDIRYEVERNSQKYQVFERRYGLFPQQSGPITIAPLRFQGLAREQGQSGKPFFNSLFNQGRRVKANSSALKIRVKPPASSFSGSTWLPAKELKIIDVSSLVDQYQVGQPVTRKIQLQAAGLTGEQLPDIEFAETPGVKFYPDKGILETQDDDENIIGVHLKSIAIIPNQVGQLTIPELAINWWNTQSDRMETARIPALSIDVVADPDAPEPSLEMTQNAQSLITDDSADSKSESAAEPTIPNPADSYWMWIALGSLGLWVITVVGFGMSRARSGDANKVNAEALPNTESEWRQRIKSACATSNPVAVRSALKGWGQDFFGHSLTLEQLANRLQNQELGLEITRLDQSLYGDNDKASNWSGDRLWKLISNFKFPNNAESGRDHRLQPLFMQEIRHTPNRDMQ